MLNAVEATVPPLPLTWKNSCFGELPRLDGVRDEHGLEMRVLAAQALHDPEEECLRELAVAARVMLDDTSIAKKTTASVAGRRRIASWRIAQVVVREGGRLRAARRGA